AGAAFAADIEIRAPWARATAKGATVGAGYMTIVNTGKSPDQLKSATADVAERVEFHEMTMENSVMTMRAVAGGVEIKPGESLAFKPGGLHLMLMGLREPLKEGASVHVTLNFAKAGAVAATLPVEALGATGPAPASGDEPPQISY
ncbi:MAG TPA: copper chaperone PCu(A)C, partial [Rhodoblastus sp.]|nr:copper chaperone PCu(A)C [Rhodoblastus sp.]